MKKKILLGICLYDCPIFLSILFLIQYQDLEYTLQEIKKKYRTGVHACLG